MKKFDGVLISTDLDGTLLRHDKTVSAENIEAIEYFKEQGGLFTFVTGRMPYYVGSILEKVKINAPYGCANGGGVYDSAKGEYLWKCVMPRDVMELVECVDKEFPAMGIQTCTFEHTYFYRNNSAMEHFRKVTGLPNLACHYKDVKEPISKILFTNDDTDEMIKISDYLDKHPLAEKFDFIRSEKTLYEILPKGMSKGTSIQKLCECLNIDINKTVAIGDFNNDISMFKVAKAGIAVANACPEALSAADYVTVSNEEHAIAQVIYDLEKGKYI